MHESDDPVTGAGVAGFFFKASIAGQGLCSHPAQLWATSDFLTHSEAFGTPKAAGVM